MRLGGCAGAVVYLAHVVVLSSHNPRRRGAVGGGLAPGVERSWAVDARVVASWIGRVLGVGSDMGLMWVEVSFDSSPFCATGGGDGCKGGEHNEETHGELVFFLCF